MKASAANFCLLWLSLSVSFLTSSRATAEASTSMIEVPTQYSTIQEAINHAEVGAVVFVKKGVYYEHVLVNKTVSLVGEDCNLTIVDGGGTESAFLVNAGGVVLEGFTARRSGGNPDDSGIRVERSSGAIITGNNLMENTNGIGFYFSNNCTVSNNSIAFNANGISLFSSYSNVISANIVSYADVGISLFLSNNNVFYGNTIFGSNSGLFLSLSSDAIFYHNNWNNTREVTSDAPSLWSYDGEGNYWSDYSGLDLNGDGIGDEPYTVDSNNRDENPLMGMFTDHTILLKNRIHEVAIISNSSLSDFSFEIGPETGNKIIQFKVANEDGTAGFCRVMIPLEFMSPPYILLLENEDVAPKILNASNQGYSHLYFTYAGTMQQITIISPEALRLYNELLAETNKVKADLYNLNVTYNELQASFNVLSERQVQLQQSFNQLNASYAALIALNVTYYDLKRDFEVLVGNYSQLQEKFEQVNSSYLVISTGFYNLLDDFSTLQKDFSALNSAWSDLFSSHVVLSGNYTQLREEFSDLGMSYQNLIGLNLTHQDLLRNYVLLLGNYTLLQENYANLNASYLSHLVDYSRNIQNIQNLIYLLVVAIAIFILTTIYLSKRVQPSSAPQLAKSQDRTNQKLSVKALSH